MAAGPTPPPDLAALRIEYGEVGLAEDEAAPDPWVQWQRWFDDAVAARLPEPNAMVVATVSADGQPSARMVLLKGLDDEGFVFLTNTESHKGTDLAAEPRCALLFPWYPLERQVRIEGVAAPLPDDEVAAYFASRPRDAQISAWASQQSRIVAGRAVLETAWAEAEARYVGGEVPKPSYWGGYRVRPRSFEFWQGRASRLHDRIRYERAGDDSGAGWERTRLAP